MMSSQNEILLSNQIQSRNSSGLISTIRLLGFYEIQTLYIFWFLILLMTYCVTICGNLLIIVVVSSSRSLHSPMYFFLTQLSLSDILLSTTIVPNTLHTVLYDETSMSLLGCLIQFYFFSASEILETLLLTVMSYDRYQAICNPLRYPIIMNLTFCLKFLALVWLTIVVVILVISVTMSHLQFCGPNTIDHFFCDRDPILELSCSDTSLIKYECMCLMIVLAVCPFLIILISYIYIIITILKISSTTGRRKTFSTCSSHLAVVSTLYVSCIVIYVFPNNATAKKIPSLLYTLVTPLLNPVIYSLANRDIAQALKTLLKKISTERGKFINVSAPQFWHHVWQRNGLKHISEQF